MNKGELTADVLNELLQIHTDRINAYKKALSKSKRLEVDLRNIFERIINESIRFKNDLNNRLNDSKPAAQQRNIYPKKIYNNWIGSKAIVSGDRKNILTGCELDEERVGDAYITALTLKNPLDSGIGQLLISQLESSEILRHQIRKFHAAATQQVS